MKHEITVIARTFEVDAKHDLNQMNKDLTILSGKAAGICYMPDDYTEKGIQDVEKALARAENNSKNGHHSVYEHGHISMIVKTNKMMCMILNSLGVYTTSEKSARYTKMQPETELELELYNKWKDKLQYLILSKYPNIDDSTLNNRLCKKIGVEKLKLVENNKILVSEENFSLFGSDGKLQDIAELLDELKKSVTLPSYKLAQENARYMISVFTPTTMMYTVSFRQLHLVHDYLYKLEVNLTENKEVFKDSFSTKLLENVKGLRAEIENTVTEFRIQENKNQYIRFLEYQHKADLIGVTSRAYKDIVSTEEEREEMLEKGKAEVIGDSYTLVYTGSLAMLAQAQRHRTIRYTMYMKEPGHFGFYVPPIVEDAGLEAEWLKDINSVAYCTPQGTMVRITEQGIFEDLVLKCKERLCGRAQLEIALSTKANLEKFTTINGLMKLSPMNIKLLESITVPFEDERGFKVVPRCLFSDFKCTEGCQWGANGLNRLI